MYLQIVKGNFVSSETVGVNVWMVGQTYDLSAATDSCLASSSTECEFGIPFMKPTHLVFVNRQTDIGYQAWTEVGVGRRSVLYGVVYALCVVCAVTFGAAGVWTLVGPDARRKVKGVRAESERCDGVDDAKDQDAQPLLAGV
ncbi:hypothetical protein HK104_008664 [Borealophlyctis nickersoniae]|nr:hypothetical protein HK104_008664 [Borealophlyctis nickersoniae]